MSPQNIWKTLDKDIDVNATEVERISLEMARTLGCTSDIDHEILQCMRARSIADIMYLYSVTEPHVNHYNLYVGISMS